MADDKQAAEVIENGSTASPPSPTPVTKTQESDSKEFVPNTKTLREDLNLIRERKSIHVYFSDVDSLQECLSKKSLQECASCTIKVQKDESQKYGWVHFHFESPEQASKFELKFKESFPEGRVHCGEFTPDTPKAATNGKDNGTSDGSRPVERTLCLLDIPSMATEAEISSVIPDDHPDIKVVLAIDQTNTFKGYAYLSYKSADDAQKAFAALKKETLKLHDKTMHVCRLTQEESRKDKKHNQIAKRGGKKGVGVCPERQALHASLEALRKQHQTASQPMERQKLKQRITTLKNMLNSYDRVQPNRHKHAKYSPSGMGMGGPGMVGYGWGPGAMRGFYGRMNDVGPLPYDQGMMDMGRGRMGGIRGNNYSSSNSKTGYVSRGKAGYPVLSSKQKQHKKPEGRGYGGGQDNRYQQQQDNHRYQQQQQENQRYVQQQQDSMIAMLESFQQISMAQQQQHSQQQQQNNYNKQQYNSGFNFKDNFIPSFGGDFNTFANGYSEDFWDGANMNGNMMGGGNQRKPQGQQGQQNNWGMGAQQQQQVRHPSPRSTTGVASGNAGAQRANRNQPQQQATAPSGYM